MLGQLFKKPTPLMVGVDIGSHSVKAVLLSEKENHYRLEAVAVESMPKGAMEIGRASCRERVCMFV